MAQRRLARRGPPRLSVLVAFRNDALLPHLWSALGLPGAEIELRFHASLPANAFTSRKALAAHAEHQVATGLEDFRAAA